MPNKATAWAIVLVLATAVWTATASAPFAAPEPAMGRPAPAPGSEDAAPLPVVPGLNADFLDGFDAFDFASATHHHDARYYTQGQVEARLASAGGPFHTLSASGGRVVEWVFSGGYVHSVEWGAPGDAVANVNPIIRLGRVATPASGGLPEGSVLSVGATYGFFTQGTCCQSTAAILMDSIVDIYKHGRGDAAHPSELRVRWVQEANGVTIDEDWTTYADRETAYLQLDITLRGDSAVAGNRVVDATLTKDGGATKSISGIRFAASSPALQSLQSSSTTTNAHHLLAAAGRLVLP